MPKRLIGASHYGTTSTSHAADCSTLVAVALVVFALVEFEKWIRYGRGRDEHALPE